MKKVTLLALICMTMVSLSSFAQGMGGGMGGGSRGGMGGGQQGQQGQQAPKREINVNFTGVAGYFAIDSAVALEKIKIKKNPQKVQDFIDVVARYTAACGDLVDENRKELDVLEFAKENMEEVEGNMNEMRELMMSVSESIKVIKPKMIVIHNALTAEMTELLNEKELNAWNKFYARLCRENSFDPKMSERGEGGERGERPSGEGGGPLDDSGRPAM